MERKGLGLAQWGPAISHAGKRELTQESDMGGAQEEDVSLGRANREEGKNDQ